MTEGNKKQYIGDVKVMNYLLQAIRNDIYNSVDACKNAKDMWERIKRLMFGSDVTSHVRHSCIMDEFDKFAAKEGESFIQFEPHVLASKANKAAKNHDPLALLVHSNASSSQSHANSSYSPQPYYKFSIPTNKHLRTSSNTRNQAVVQDGRVDIQTKNTGYEGNGNRIAGRQNKNQAFNAGNGNDDNNHIKPRVHDAKYFREKMLLAMKDEAGSNLKDEENDFLLDNSYGEETIEELTTAVMLMARIQPAVGNAETVPSYDAKAVSKVNASSKVHEQVSH
ncbi:hypothetical protein Tco_1101338, partial [Tanacetum coccineum]